MKTFTKTIYKSAIDGRFISKEFANENPETTIAQKVEVKRKSKNEDQK